MINWLKKRKPSEEPEERAEVIDLPEALHDAEARREFVQNIENMIVEHPKGETGNNNMCPLGHHFADGCYIREMFMPAGILLTGKIHKYEHPTFLLEGVVSIVTDDGAVLMSAPQLLISPAGTKRMIFSHTDAILCTVHVTNETDVEKIEADIVTDSWGKFEEFKRIEEKK